MMTVALEEQQKSYEGRINDSEKNIKDLMELVDNLSEQVWQLQQIFE